MEIQVVTVIFLYLSPFRIMFQCLYLERFNSVQFVGLLVTKKVRETNVAKKSNLKMLDFPNFDVFDETYQTSMLFYAWIDEKQRKTPWVRLWTHWAKSVKFLICF